MKNSMTKIKKNGYVLWLMCALSLLTACSPIKAPVSNQYTLNAFYTKKRAVHNQAHSILISQPDAIAGYQTEQMLYTDRPFEINAFAHSAWISSPANMLYPLITQSLQHSHYFFAVAAGPDADKTDYRLDTQVLALQQNFIKKPSTIELAIQCVLTHVDDNRVVASRMFTQKVVCPSDTPYGGVIAANKAAYSFTTALTNFVIGQVQREELH